MNVHTINDLVSLFCTYIFVSYYMFIFFLISKKHKMQFLLYYFIVYTHEVECIIALYTQRFCKDTIFVNTRIQLCLSEVEGFLFKSLSVAFERSKFGNETFWRVEKGFNVILKKEKSSYKLPVGVLEIY